MKEFEANSDLSSLRGSLGSDISLLNISSYVGKGLFLSSS